MYIIIINMLRKLIFTIFALVMLITSGCVYYNLFYNAEHKFREAETNQANANQNKSGRSAEVIHNRAGEPIAPSISINDKNLYKAAIDKANKVVQYHPDSKYIDDALWLIGKSRFNMTEYITADKKLRELIVRDPNSEYVDDAYFYIGMSQFWLNEYDRALTAFNNVLNLKKSKYKDDAAFNIAYIDYLEGNFNSAITSFKKMIDDYPKSDSAATAQFFIAVSYDSLRENQSALAAYRLVKKYGPSHELYFDAQFAYGTSAFSADSIKLGMGIFTDLAGEERYYEKSSIIKVKYAEGLYLMGQVEEAVKEFLDVCEKYSRTEQSTESYYRLGLIYQDYYFDLNQAKEYFNKATQEKRDSDFRNLALARSAQISKLESYRIQLGLDTEEISAPDSAKADSLKDEQTAVDSVASQDRLDISLKPTGENPYDGMDSAQIANMPPAIRQMMERMDVNKPQSKDSLIAAEPTTVDSFTYYPELLNSPPYDMLSMYYEDTNEDSLLLIANQNVKIDSSDIKKGIEVRFLLAELYHHDLNRPDSALNEYIQLIDNYPESEYAPKALLAAASIYENKADTILADSLYRQLVKNYPSTDQAQLAADKIEDARIPEKYDIPAMYRTAEDLFYVQNDPQGALEKFAYIEENFPESDYAAKSAFARVYIEDQIRQERNDSSIYLLYADIVERYPETPYAYGAKLAMGIEKRVDPRVKKSPVNVKKRSSQPESQDSLDQELEDSLFVGMPWAPPAADSFAFLYPESLLDEGHREKGKVIFKIRLDLFGNITEHQLLGTSGNEVIDSVATETLLLTTFDTSGLDDLSLLDGYFRYDIRFEPPENWEDRYDRAGEYDERYNQQRERGP